MAINTAVVGALATVFCLQAVSAFIPVQEKLPRPRCLKYACKCPYGSVTIRDRFGCERCSCNPNPCPNQCDLLCLNGNVLDKNGCRTCECKPNQCPRVCEIFCEHGNVLDRNGCPTCECKSKPTCPPVCAIFCPNGNVPDENGCPTCRCKPECPLRKCQACEHGYLQDKNGCNTCECKPRFCPLRCRPGYADSCPFGLDENPLTGCPICRCKTDPGHLCPGVRCPLDLRCPFGFKNINGCHTCICADKPACPVRPCKKPCQHGVEVDSDGCPTCECKCPQFRCPPCLNGHVLDSDGCKTCSCKPETPQCSSFHCRFYCMMPSRFGSSIDRCGCHCGRPTFY